MRYWLLIVVLYVAAVLDTALEPVFCIGRFTPDWLALVAVAWPLYSRRPGSLIVAAVVGLVADLIFPGRLGIGMAWFALVGYGVAHLASQLGKSRLGTHLGITWVAVFALSFGITASRWALGEVSAGWSSLCGGSLAVASYTTVVGGIVFVAFQWLGKPVWRPSMKRSPG